MTVRILYRGTLWLAAIAVPLVFVVPAGWYLAKTKSQSPYCTNWKGLLDMRVQLGRDNAANRIAKNMRRVGEDQKLSLVLWESPVGRFWVPTGSPMLLAYLLAQQQSDIYGDEQAGVHSRDVVIDCGAHVGVFVKKALSRGARLVVAVEPAPQAAECLRRNFSDEIRNGTVIVCQKAIWEKPEMTLKFFLNGNGDAADSLVWQAKDVAAVDVKTTTIDAIAADYHLDRIDFIKADIKGAAASMLRGAKDTLVRSRPRMAISTEEGFDHPAEIATLVSGMAPNYRSVCGPCVTAAGSIFTDVMFFQ
ncbi:MAG: FkbM family methyltransferase [Acidobacteriia bacterium]|nr:FkbM family methyltransferase [Terriglobia bacterium]